MAVTITNLMKNQDTIIIYFSNLKALFDELLNYESFPNCMCGRLKAKIKYQQKDYVVKLIIGLNKSYKAIKA